MLLFEVSFVLFGTINKIKFKNCSQEGRHRTALRYHPSVMNSVEILVYDSLALTT